MTENRTAVTSRAEVMFKALASLGAGWHSRADIAAQLGKKQLSSYDAAALEVLLEQGRVEVTRREIPGPIPLRWEYQVKE